MTTATREFKPRRPSFLWPRIAAAVLVIGFLSVGLTVAALLAELAIVLIALPVVWLGIGLPALYAAHIAYTKERYEIHADHLISHHGGVFSDNRTELDIHNVTHVRLRLPWLRHKIFGIGDVRIESAGSAASEITFESIVDPEAVFKEVQDLMRSNGYAMQCAETLHEESPGVIGALTDVAQVGFFGGLSALIPLALGASVLAEISLTDGSAGEAIVVGLGGLTAVGAVAATVAGLVIRYLDMRRRTYTVYDDAVAYTEGFMTRDNAIIPFENIADASTTQAFVDQLLGLYNVRVSCQGSGSEILFRCLSNGQPLRAAIATLVANASKKSRDLDAQADAVAVAESEAAPEGGAGRAATPAKRKLVDPDAAWTAELKMHVGRAQMPALLALPFQPIWLFAAAAAYIKSTRTTFTVGPNSLSSSYSFIGSNQQEFAYDKVTGVQVDRNPLDGMFDTLSVQIWSIGSPQPLNLAYIPNASLNLPALLKQCGINADDPVEGELEQSFGPKIWAIQNVFALLFLVMAVVGLLVGALFAGPLVLLVAPFFLALPLPMAIATSMRVKRQRITFHAEHVEAQTGIFFRRHIYARYDNVKKVESTQIPLTDHGRLKLYIAGEKVVENGEGSPIKTPYSLEGSYIEGISLKTDAVDALMLGLIEPSQIRDSHPQGDDVISVYKPAVANSIAITALIGLFFPPLWLILPIVALQIRMRSYSIEKDRVVERGGIFFKYATSVLFNRIDSLQQNQGALGKAFGNGTVTILTAGSSAPDLSVANVPDYQEAYTTIRKHYGKKEARS